ncbi:N-acetyltransferase [Candidatus Bipolaricaulota bacterium]|nr:N-acetyltransferase [Candidatus Bipolaricaulota bacterium]TFH09654.1 MAG: N-acetyltransferase [Candidatus Atribacteria bacterium]
MKLNIEQYALGDRRLKDFVRVPWELYRGDPHWTPPLGGELLGNRLLGLKGLLTPQHPYHEDAEVTHFVAYDGRRLLGRVSAAVNHRFNAHYDSTIGFFGFFEVCNDYAVAEALLNHARDWIQDNGMTVMRGPGAYSNATTEAHQAVLIDGFDTPPTVELTHNPPYYGAFLDRYGLKKVKDYHAYRISLEPPSQRLIRVAKAVQERRNIETQVVVMKNLRSEVDRIVEIYNEAWANNWGFLPINSAEADATADNLRLVIDPGLMRFATVNGELAAVLGALPDPNIPLRPRWNRLQDTDMARALRLLRTRRRIPVMRLMFFGVRPKFRKLGIDALLYLQVQEYAVKHGYKMCEPSMLLEDNDLILRASSSMDGERYKTWRVYEMAL